MGHEKMGDTVEELERIASALRKRIREASDKLDTLRHELVLVEDKIKGLREKP